MTDDLQDLGRPDDGTGEMRPVRLDAHTAERLLSGQVTADDAPPGYARVVGLLGSARSPAAGVASPRETSTVGAMSVALAGQGAPASPVPDQKRTSMLSKALSIRAAVVTSAVLLGTGTAAAATGSLPGGAQSAAAEVLHDVGISVPGSSSHPDDRADSRGTSDTTQDDEGHESTGAPDPDEAADTDKSSSSTSDHDGKGPGSHALFGLCTARAANDGHPNAHADHFPSAAECASVKHPGTKGGDESTDSTGATTDHPEGPDTGPNGGQPSTTPGSDEARVSTPNEGAASDSAPGGAGHGPGPDEPHGNGPVGASEAGPSH